MSNNPAAALTVSLKGQTQDQPWLVINADSPDQLTQRLNAVVDTDLPDLIQVAQARYHLALGGIKAESVQQPGWQGEGGDPVRHHQPVPPPARPQAGGHSKYPDRIYLPQVTFDNKDEAKAMGARFDPERKQWFSTPKFNNNHDAVVAQFG